MINFRYHVVSILAVFLALAIGTVMGAAFVGQGVIDGLRGRIDEVERNANDARARDAKTQAENDRLQAFVDESAPFTVTGRLTGIRINMVAERGVSGEAIDAQAALLRGAGATVPGVVWLEDRWQLGAASDAAALRTATGLTNRSRETLRSAAAQLLGQRLGAEPPVTDDVLNRLADGGFVTLTGVDGSASPTVTDFTGTAARLLALGGPGHAVPPIVTTGVAQGAIDANARVAIAQVFEPSDNTITRDAWLDVVADTDALRGRVSTVNDAELVEGQIGTALVLDELGRGTFGAYGVDEDRALPEYPTAVPVGG